ncbi:hypothetical protein AJ79_09536 [Helicocarpus griseus UAMH5409]|uniref:Aminoglycoside phosphotransferase domain-containing protein n=1 Tax=Helicocarpus griseus UAMH5409 TaxID=1447875 RepID=A0A2B7WIV4_9EURO|nr:hypothetical protein AJ79_09536 [Helicocarpus griseus UAMH5409]
MGRVYFPNNWIGNLEKSTWVPPIPGALKGKAEAQAVYHCEEIVQGKRNGRKAIVKVRMQVPPELPPSFNPKVRAQLAESVPAGWTRKKLHSLTHFNEKKCTVVPKLLNVVSSWQDGPEMPVPNGYLVFIVMEELPGVSLADYPPEKRDKIRASFKTSLTELFSFHGRPWDCRLENLIYDEKTDKSYFVDFEGVDVTEDKPALNFSDDYFYLWGLLEEEYSRSLPLLRNCLVRSQGLRLLMTALGATYYRLLPCVATYISKLDT